MKIKIANDKAWVVINDKAKAREIYEAKLFKLCFIPSGAPLRSLLDLKSKKKIGIKVQWNNEPLLYKEAMHLKELGYDLELELSCRLVLSHKKNGTIN